MNTSIKFKVVCKTEYIFKYLFELTSLSPYVHYLNLVFECICVLFSATLLDEQKSYFYYKKLFWIHPGFT